MAEYILAAPGSKVYVERIFSVFGLHSHTGGNIKLMSMSR